MKPMRGRPVGWYRDDKVSTLERWWNGEAWEDRWRTAGRWRRWNAVVSKAVSALYVALGVALAIGVLFGFGSCVVGFARDVGESSDARDAEVDCRVQIEVESRVPINGIVQGDAVKIDDGSWRVVGYYDTPFERVRYACRVDGDRVTVWEMP